MIYTTIIIWDTFCYISFKTLYFIIKTGSAQTTENNAVRIFLRTIIWGNNWTIVDNTGPNDTDKI